MAMIKKSMLFFTLFTLLACTEKPQVQVQGSEIEQKCSANNFVLFLSDFLSSASEQKKYTSIPLQNKYVDAAASPEPKPIEETLSLNQISFPVLAKNRLEERGAFMYKILIYGKKAEVRFAKPDTDFVVDYLFKHTDCWRLYRVEDHSL